MAKDAAGQLVAREGHADGPLRLWIDRARLLPREAHQPNRWIGQRRGCMECWCDQVASAGCAEEQLREVPPLGEQARLIVAECHDTGRCVLLVLPPCTAEPLGSDLANSRDLRPGNTVGVHEQAAVLAQLHARQDVDAVHHRLGLAEEEHRVKGAATVGTAVLGLYVEQLLLPLHHTDKPRIEVRVHRGLTARLHLLHQPRQHLYKVVLPRAGVYLLQEPRDLRPRELAEGDELDRRPARAHDADAARPLRREHLQEVLRLGTELAALKALSGAVDQGPLPCRDEVMACRDRPNLGTQGVLQQHVQALLLRRGFLGEHRLWRRHPAPESSTSSAEVSGMAHTAARRVGGTLLCELWVRAGGTCD
mmetsp:Transcript_294/g.819  ORF Transcript_294/g.819 Transcript_294/m.819 type:complete len:364 (+) Transcript_294:555-1646(+)